MRRGGIGRVEVVKGPPVGEGHMDAPARSGPDIAPFRPQGRRGAKGQDPCFGIIQPRAGRRERRGPRKMAAPAGPAILDLPVDLPKADEITKPRTRHRDM